MKVIVIGGAGYIGSHVTLALLEKGHEVWIYDNLSSGMRENIFAETVFVHGDINDPVKLNEVMQNGFDAAVHLAAFKAAGESMQKPEKYSVNNICGTIHILNSMVTSRIPSIVFSSSAAIYGEPEYLPIDEAHPTKPTNYYGFTKLEIERFLHWYHHLKELNYASLRYFNAAGYDQNRKVKGIEQNPANLLPVIMEVAAGRRTKLTVFGDDYPTKDGTGIRDYIHVTDLADAHVRALEYIQSEKSSLTVNLGSEEGISVNDMVQTARTITGKPIPMEIGPRRPGDPASLVASSKKARHLLSWEARYSDVENLVRTAWDVYKLTSQSVSR